MRSLFPWIAMPFACALVACGGGGGAAPSPVPPSPTPTPGLEVRGLVFYDEDDDGQLDPGETVRVPDVDVVIGGGRGRSERNTGRVTVQGVSAGTHATQIDGASLPPFYRVSRAVQVTAPQAAGAVVQIPVTLPIGNNTPNVYMAFGDSLTRGFGSNPGGDYPSQLFTLLGGYFAGAQVSNRGADGTNSYEALERFRRNFNGQTPAYTLILYGTNDWNDPACQDIAPCFTIENLRTAVSLVTRNSSLPVVGLIPPVNPAINDQRNKWVRDINVHIREMAVSEGAIVADTYGKFQEKGGDLSRFFVDHVHFNDAGYKVIAEAFFEAIAGRGVKASSGLGWKPGGGVW